jgi:hypothetical protein
MTLHPSVPPVIAPRSLASSAPASACANAAERWVAAGIALCCGAVLGVALWLDPSPTGVGTHQALGLAPCGWVAGFGLPCPACGMTTAFSHAAHGSLWAAFRVQPMGAVLAVATAAAFLVAVYVALTGSRLGHVLCARLTPRVLLVLGLATVVAWVYKIILVRGAMPALLPS